ncbi:MAG: prenyltransferase [Actinomycetota bacterium]|nr:prenyltransferase [Actinomycetota bacterium]
MMAAADLTGAEIHRSARSIADLQLPSGMIEWFPGGHTDPWNHIEAAMALATCGLVYEAERAYDWLAGLQRADGSWHNYYTAAGVEDPKLDTNCVAYIATGIWHHYLTTGDVEGLVDRWSMVEQAIDFVLTMQTSRGEVVWARNVEDRPWTYALLTGSSSIGHSLGCAIRIAETLDKRRDDWREARTRLVAVVANQPQIFEPKDRWAMDWYYPVLTGAVVGEAARTMLRSGWDTFVMEGKGVRCVSDRPWVTTAETAECAIAHLATGEPEKASDLLAWTRRLRDHDGSYFTGLAFPELVFFPGLERSAYSAAAVILAADAISGGSPTSGLFVSGSAI